MVDRQFETLISFPDMQYSNRQVLWLSKLMQYKKAATRWSNVRAQETLGG